MQVQKRCEKVCGAFICALSITGTAASETHGKKETAPTSTIPDSGLTGKQLAERYCSTCHLVPQPADAPKGYWPALMQWMGNYLGMNNFTYPGLKIIPPPPQFETESDYMHLYSAMDKDGYINPYLVFDDFVPPQPLISYDDWVRKGNAA